MCIPGLQSLPIKVQLLKTDKGTGESEMKLKERFSPALLVSESFYPLLKDEDKLFSAVERVLRDGYYRRIETGALKTVQARKKFTNLVEQLNLGFTQWITNDISERNLNPSTTDRQLRERTIREICDLVEIAHESGADRVAMVSGPDSGSEVRGDALKGLEEVLLAVSDKLAQHPGMVLLLEPLDRGAHKNNLIGPTEDAVALMKKISRFYSNCLLSWDSAHMALNKENLEKSLEEASEYVGHIHLANAILNPEEAGYGDWHMPMGKPGFLDVDCGRSILRYACTMPKLKKDMGVSIESRCLEHQDPFLNEKKCRTFLQEVLEGEGGMNCEV